MTIRIPALVLALVAAAPGLARADEAGGSGVRFELLPGASGAISHSASASRDTALLGYQLTPYSSLTAGGDLGLFLLDFDVVTFRLGFFGMLELESDRPLDPETDGFNGLLPSAGVAFWRGLEGASAAVSLDRLARTWLGARGELEAALSFRHESEHFTGSPDGSEPQYQDVPHIGNFLMPEVAARIPVGPVDLEFRLQVKAFLPQSGVRFYSVGPGADVIVRWRLCEWAQPFSATFAEYLVGMEASWEGRSGVVPDNYLVRNLTGVAFPNAVAEIQVFTSFAVGHGKGLLVYREEFLWGGGVRIAFF